MGAGALPRRHRLMGAWWLWLACAAVTASIASSNELRITVDAAAADPRLQAAFEPWLSSRGDPARRGVWTGGDVGATTALTPERTLWVFGDTLIGHWNTTTRQRISDARPGEMPHSSIGIMDLSKPPSSASAMEWHWGADGSSFFRPEWERNAGPGRQAFWAAVTTPRAVGDRLLVIGNRVLYTAAGGPMGFIVNETIIFTVDGATTKPDDPQSWRLAHFALPNTGKLSHLPSRPTVDLARGALLVGGGANPAGEGANPWLYLYGYVLPAGGSSREVVSRIRWQSMQQRDFAKQQYWIDGGEPAAAPRWQQGWSDDLPQTMATLWKPQVAEMQVQWSAALGCYVVVDIPYLSTVVEMRHAPAPQGPWSAPQIVYHIPPPQNDTRHFFCYTAMQHDTASLPPTAPSQSPSALASEAEVVFTYVCNGKTLGDVFAKGAWASYTPQFVRLRLSKAAPLKADDADAAPCNLTGTWHGHPGGPHGRISATPIPVVQSTASSFVALGNKRGTVSGATVEWGGLTGTLSANTEHNASAPPCTRISWHNQKRTYWCREPWCELAPPAPPPPAPWVPPPPPPPPPPGVNLPNVIFIITDDQDVELGSLSSMPILQRELVQQGTTLANFFVDVPVCCPSRTSFLSGRYAHNNGACGIAPHSTAPGGWCGNGHFWKGPLQHHTVATYMKSAGYVTGIFGKELNEVDVNFVPPGWDRYYALVNECEYFGNSFADDGRRTTVPPDMYMTTALLNASTSWMRAQLACDDGGSGCRRPFPFFAYIGPHAPHQSATPDIMHEGKFADRRAPRTPAWNYSAPDHHWLVSSQPPLAALDERESDEMFRRRWRSLQSVDEMIGGIVQLLEETKQLENAVIVYSADHGYHLGQWRIPAHKELAYETDLRVPFIVRGPGVRKNVVVNAIGLNIDVAVTLADFGGFVPPDEAMVDGRSLKPLLVGAEAEAAWPRTEFLFEHEGGDIKPFSGADANHCTLNWLRPDGGSPANPTVPGLCSCGNPMQHWISSKNNTYKGLRYLNATHNYKLVRYDDDVNFEELFDLSSDPYELRNIIGSAPAGLLEEMRLRLAELRGCGKGPNATVLCP